MIPAETERPSSFTGTGISLAPTFSNAILAPKYPGSSIHIGSLFFRSNLAKRSSACCIPETRTICSAMHRTPRDVRKYSAIASRSGRYPRRSDSCFNHDPKLRARFAVQRSRGLTWGQIRCISVDKRASVLQRGAPSMSALSSMRLSSVERRALGRLSGQVAFGSTVDSSQRALCFPIAFGLGAGDRPTIRNDESEADVSG